MVKILTMLSDIAIKLALENFRFCKTEKKTFKKKSENFIFILLSQLMNEYHTHNTDHDTFYIKTSLSVSAEFY